MIEPEQLRGVDGARLAAAAGVVTDAIGVDVPEAFEWLMDVAGLSRIPICELADLVVLAAVQSEP
jgi:hypothetical protein